jgi:hypothetical protein
MELNDLIRLLQVAEKGGLDKKNQFAVRTVGTPATSLMYANGMFAYNTETDIISAVMTDDKLADWLGFLPSTDNVKTNKMLEWVGPQGTTARTEVWDRTETCGDCPSIEWGKCETISCFGEICGASPVLKLSDIGLKAWEGQPMYYLQGPLGGQQIQDDEQWMLALVAHVMRQNMIRKIIVGNKSVTTTDFDGLQVLINTPVTDYRTGNRCEGVEPVIVDWASAAASDSICDYINAIVRRIRRRGGFLGGVRSSQGDLVMVMTSTMRDALLDIVACGCHPCSGTVTIDAIRRREERDRLSGGLYGDGWIPVDGEAVPIITCDWIPETQAAPRFCSDIFFLTRRVGAIPTLYGQYQNFAATTAGMDISARVNGFVSDSGRYLNWFESKNECYKASSLAKMRLVLSLPWLQARITSVCAPFTLQPINANPASDYWYANTPEQAAALPETWYGACGGTAGISLIAAMGQDV